MKKALVAMVLLAGGLMAAPQVRVGVRFGAPAPVAVVQPACPGRGYTWVDGYYGTGGWVAGYWAPPVVQVAPRFGFAYRGHVDHDRVVNRGRVDHDRGEHVRR